MTNEMKGDRASSDTDGTDDNSGPVWTDLSESDGERAEAMFVADFDGTITSVNGSFEELFSVAGGDPLGGSVHRYLTPAEGTELGRKLLTRLRDGGSVSRELTLDTAAGEDRPVLFKGFPLGPGSEPKLVGIFIDRTDRQRSEAKASLLTEVSRRLGAADTYCEGVETAVEAICTYTEWCYGEVWTPDDGDVLGFSLGYTDDPRAEAFRAASEEVSFALGEGLPGRVAESQSAEWVPDVAAESTDVLCRTELATAADFRAAFAVPVVADDTVVSVLVFFMRDHRERDARLAADVSEVVSALGELVERKRIEDRRRLQNEQLDRFTRTVSHDLRNPLSVARGYLENAQRTSSSDALCKVSTALDRMDELIENLLTLSRDGDVIGDRRLLSLEATASAAWECVDTEAATLDVKAGQLRGDPARVQQLFENLFRNSVEHGRRDVTIRVGPLEPIRTSTRSDSRLAGGFYVADDGPGIPPDEREAVFDASYSTGGTGFGLQTVERIAAAHGWAVTCTEGQDGGARFEFTATAPTADSTAAADR